MAPTVHLGFAIGTGDPVSIPLGHTFITGQTQSSGKTTALEAIASRAGRPALAFITKRGESLNGRRIRPYLPREGTAPIHWRLVETIMASALGQRHLKFERFQILNAARGAMSLADVRANLTRLAKPAKKQLPSKVQETYTLLGEYLDLVLPEMAALDASDELDLQPGLNVMDLGGATASLQALVIRAALERINQHGRHILTVLPEAWQFAPRDAAAPAKEEAIHMARKGAAPDIQNFLLCDSQDIAGVAPVLRQASSVWILGVQRELNELKRLLQMIPADIAKPKPADVTALGLGEFFVCFGRTVVKTYVQPSWMPASIAQARARGLLDATSAASLAKASIPRRVAYDFGREDVDGFTPVGTLATQLADNPADVTVGPRKEKSVTRDEADALRADNTRLLTENADLRRRLEALERASGPLHTRGTDAPAAPCITDPARRLEEVPVRLPAPFTARDDEEFYQRLKARLMVEAPAILQVLALAPELHVAVERPVLDADGDSVKGKIAQLIARGFFERPQSGGVVQKELAAQGMTLSPGSLYPALDDLTKLGFLRISDGKDERARPRKEYTAVPEMKASVTIRKAS